MNCWFIRQRVVAAMGDAPARTEHRFTTEGITVLPREVMPVEYFEIADRLEPRQAWPVGDLRPTNRSKSRAGAVATYAHPFLPFGNRLPGCYPWVAPWIGT
jgi:hypothetical protein